MKDIRITAVAKVRHDELIERYELPLEEECTVAVGDSFVSCQTGIIRTSLGAILFGAFAQPKLADMYTIACVPPEQNHPKISCSEVRAVPRLPIFG